MLGRCHRKGDKQSKIFKRQVEVSRKKRSVEGVGTHVLDNNDDSLVNNNKNNLVRI